MSKGFILFLLTEAVPTVPYEILKMEKKSGTDIWRIHAKSIKYRFVDVTPILGKIQTSFSDITSFEGRSILHRCLQ